MFELRSRVDSDDRELEADTWTISTALVAADCDSSACAGLVQESWNREQELLFEIAFRERVVR